MKWIKKLNSRCNYLEAQINQKMNIKQVRELEERIAELELQQENLKLKNKQEKISIDAYSKRFNLIIHGLKKNRDKAWESREETESVFYKFLSKGIGLNRTYVKLADLHRLTQQPIFEGTVKIDRSIIFKLTNAGDKHAIMSRLKNLKSYNELVKRDDPTAPYVRVSVSTCLKNYTNKRKNGCLNLRSQRKSESVPNGP